MAALSAAMALAPRPCLLAQRSARPAGGQLVSRPLAPAFPLARPVTSSVVPRANDVKASIPEEVKAEDRPNYIALAAYAVSELLKYQGGSLPGFPITLTAIYSSLAWVVLSYAALSVALDKFSNDHIGLLVGPAVLAIQALNGIPRLHLSPWQTASAAFGTLLIKRLPTFQYSTWVWLASLGAAVWKNLSAEWVVGAFGLAAAYRVVNGFNDKKVPVQEVAFAALAALAAFQGAYEGAALAIFAGHVASSAISAVQNVANESS